MTSYREEVLGRFVVVNFLVKNDGTRRPFLGKITDFKIALLDNGELEKEHLIRFDDGDRVWFDLTKEERNNRLTWINNSAPASSPELETTKAPAKKRQKKIKKEVIAAAAAPATAAAAAPTQPVSTKKNAPVAFAEIDDPAVPSQTTAAKSASAPSNGPGAVTPTPCAVTPDTTMSLRPRSSRKPSHRYTDSQVGAEGQSRKLPGKKGFVGIPPKKIPNEKRAREEEENDKSGNWVKNMDYWIRNVPHGYNKDSPYFSHNCSSVMGKVKKLATGEGITCPQWPDEVRFYAGVKVDPDNFDFEKMLAEAKKIQANHVKDSKGFGNNLGIAFRKLIQYQEYRKALLGK